MPRLLFPPTPLPTTAHLANLRGIRLMTAAMACFIVNDTLVKVASQWLPAGQLIFVRGLIATALVLAVMRATATPVSSLRRAGRVVAWRAALDALATFAYLLSLFHLPLGNATAINMASPLVITLAAALLLGERVGPWRWAAVALGFAGVLLVVQPGLGGFNAWAWLCLGGTTLHALRDLLTRHVPAGVPSLAVTLATAAAVTTLAGAVTLVQGWVPMGPRQLAVLAAAAVFLASGYHLVIQATRIGELSAEAPFRYSGLLMAVAAGWLVWGEVPNALAWAGIAAIVSSGLYLLRPVRP
ncbi:MAG: DMT family transporter [Rubrivivax sp.]